MDPICLTLKDYHRDYLTDPSEFHNGEENILGDGGAATPGPPLEITVNISN